jgi:hypothetical protein
LDGAGEVLGWGVEALGEGEIGVVVILEMICICNSSIQSILF